MVRSSRPPGDEPAGSGIESRRVPMRHSLWLSACAALLIAGTMSASAQKQAPAPAPPKPYKALAVMSPAPMSDPAFEALRKQLGEIAQKKDRAALARLVVAQGFFWERETGDGADKKKSGIDNLATALGLNNKNGAGWEILFSFTDDPTASASPDHKGAVCAPAEPGFDGQAFDDLLKATQTDPSEWGYPMSAGLEVHAAPQANAPVIEKLGVVLVRVMPENAPPPPAYLRIVTPAGNAGFVSVDAIAPLGNDQLCYIKDGDAWKIGGYIGGGEPQ
jgi:hypothetical protein